MANGFKKVAREAGDVWMHPTAPIWIVEYDGVKNVRPRFFQAYRAIHRVPAGRAPWSIDNRRIGDDRGFPSLKAAIAAANHVAASAKGAE